MADFPILKWLTIDGRNVPFTYPQHRKSDGSYVETGEDNPLPTAGYGMTEGGLWIPKKVSDDGTTLTQLTGSIVEEVIFDAYEIRDTNTHDAIVDLSKYKKVSIFAYNSHDVDIKLNFRLPHAGGVGGTASYFKSDGTISSFPVVDLQRHRNIYVSSGLPARDAFTNRLGLRLTTTAAPTVGLLYIRIFGEVYA